jgi:hypothetical protein
LPIAQSEVSKEAWSLEPPAVRALMAKMKEVGRPLVEVAGKPYRGVVTGCNEAFVISAAQRGALLREDARSAEVIFPFLRGRDLDRWVAQRSDQYMIFTRRGIDIEQYPAVKRHLEGFRAQLEPKPAGFVGDWAGRKPGTYKWFEIQDSVDYWQDFARQKIVFPDIIWTSSFCLDQNGNFLNNTSYFIPCEDVWPLIVLNSPLMWSFLWRNAQHGKDEALRMFSQFMVTVPIAEASASTRQTATETFEEVAALTQHSQQSTRDVIDWLRDTHQIDPPGRILESFAQCDTETFLSEVKKRRPRALGTLRPAALRELKQLHEAERLPMLQRAQRIAHLEKTLSTLVNEAFHLTPEELDLLRKTAPPRTPPGL